MKIQILYRNKTYHTDILPHYLSLKLKTKILLPTRDEQELIQRGKGSEKVSSLKLFCCYFFFFEKKLKVHKTKVGASTIFLPWGFNPIHQ